MDEERKRAGKEDLRRKTLGREVVESHSVYGVSREKLFAMLADVERFPEWGYGLRRVRLRHAGGAETGPDLRPGARIEFKLSAAGLTHRVTSVVTAVEPPSLIEWRYLSGAFGHGGWLLEEREDSADPVRLTLSTDYSLEPAWLDKMARKPFFRGLTSDLLRRSLRRLESRL